MERMGRRWLVRVELRHWFTIVPFEIIEYLGIAFGVDDHTSYFALCWYTGILPARFRIGKEQFE